MLVPMTASASEVARLTYQIVGISRSDQGREASVAPKTRCAAKVVICRPGRPCESGDMRRDYESLDRAAVHEISQT
jgi:hypothetical protein